MQGTIGAHQFSNRKTFISDESLLLGTIFTVVGSSLVICVYIQHKSMQLAFIIVVCSVKSNFLSFWYEYILCGVNFPLFYFCIPWAPQKLIYFPLFVSVFLMTLIRMWFLCPICIDMGYLGA